MKTEVLGYGIPENNNTSDTAPAQNFVDTTEDDENRNVIIVSSEDNSDFEIDCRDPPAKKKLRTIKKQESSDSPDDSENEREKVLRRNAGDPYKGDHSLPVYQWGSENTSSGDVLKILLKPVEEALLCKKPPKSVSHNVCFLLDTTLLKSSNDWKCDDLGSWKHNEFPNLIFLQYVFTGKEHPVEVATHGNCNMRLAPAYIRTKESTVEKLRHEAISKVPKDAYHRVNKDQCGLVDANNADDFMTKLLTVKESWNAKEQQYLPTGTNATFYDYIAERAEMLISSMSRETRVNAGLGDPPLPYFNNMPESANDIYD
ncbi:Hypothetical predicted protein [Paramuricea clavata]|uniref:Uncharacterized protein n=1 Tax=Paramuricea clavata TaxID=317549 RepID=A0A6S7K7F9_PARCT|nr:Hypothetical predicted protein [Paramuricea clavata]